MELPKPTEQHKRLEAMVGEWTSEETMHPSPWDPKGGQATGRTTTRMDLDGFFAVTNYVQQRDGRVTYRGHGVYGWDPSQEQYMMHWFDSIGMDPGPPAPGRWEGDTLCFQHQTKMGHSRYTTKFLSKDAYTFKLESSPDGQNWSVFMEGTYKRAP